MLVDRLRISTRIACQNILITVIPLVLLATTPFPLYPNVPSINSFHVTTHVLLFLFLFVKLGIAFNLGSQMFTGTTLCGSLKTSPTKPSSYGFPLMIVSKLMIESVTRSPTKTFLAAFVIFCPYSLNYLFFEYSYPSQNWHEITNYNKSQKCS